VIGSERRKTKDRKKKKKVSLRPNSEGGSKLNEKRENFPKMIVPHLIENKNSVRKVESAMSILEQGGGKWREIGYLRGNTEKP